MKFLSSLKSAALPTLFLVLVLALAGCGGNSNSNNNLALTQGNWSMTAVSTNPSLGTFYVGGNLTQNGTTLSGTMYSISYCISPSVKLSFSGTIKDKQITLTSATDSNGEVITIVASATNGSALSGSYSVTGGTCANGDHGTIAANPVASITGTWSGPLNDPSDPNATLSIALTQAATASADGTFALTGTLTYTSSVCAATGTITSGSLAGPSIVSFNATTNTGDTVFYSGGMLDSTTTPKNITTGTYSYGTCDTNTETPTFTKQ